MPINKETVKRLLLFLEESLKELSRPNLNKEDLKTDNDLRLAMERRLQTSIEACIDIAFHIISGEKLGLAEHNRDAIILLGEKSCQSNRYEKCFSPWIRLYKSRSLL